MSEFKKLCRLLAIYEDTENELRKDALEDEKTKLELNQQKIEFVIKATEIIKDFSDKLLAKKETPTPTEKSLEEILKTPIKEATSDEIRKCFEAVFAPGGFVNRGGFNAKGEPIWPDGAKKLQAKNMNDFGNTMNKSILDKVDLAEQRLGAINLLKSEGYKILKPITKYKPV